MSTINNVQIIGNITASPITKVMTNSVKVTTYNVATNHIYTGPNGEKNSEVEYHRCVAFGNLAEVIEKYITTGKKVYVQGRLKTKKWETETGEKKQVTEIITEKIVILSPKTGEKEEEFMGENDNF